MLVGKIILAPAGPNKLLCIDGQQRITSLLLAVAAVRDHVELLCGVVGSDDDECSAAARELLAVANCVLCFGGSPDAPRLVPSLEDRASYVRLAGIDRDRDRACGTADQPAAAVMNASFLDQAHATLSSCVSAQLAQLIRPRDRVRALASMLDSLLLGASYVHVELKSLEHAQQVFLWLAEQSLMNGLLLMNASPGEQLRACDLLRNAVLAYWLDADEAAQDQVLQLVWLPIERRFTCPDAFDCVLSAFAVHKGVAVGASLHPELYRMRDAIRLTSARPDWSGAELYMALAAQWLGPGVAGAASAQEARDACLGLLAEIDAFAVSLH